MGRLNTKTAKCQYKEYGHLLIEQFVSGPNDDGMINNIPKEVAIKVIEDEDATNEHTVF